MAWVAVRAAITAGMPHSRATMLLWLSGPPTSVTTAAACANEDGADILVHELGHNLGRQHAPCSVSDPDPNYPHPYAMIDDTGWDPQGAAGGKVQSFPQGYIVPASSFDVMSYCQDEWISEYTYRAILQRRGSAPAQAGAAPTAGPDAPCPFAIEPKGPEVVIVSPAGGGSMPSGRPCGWRVRRSFLTGLVTSPPCGTVSVRCGRRRRAASGFSNRSHSARPGGRSLCFPAR